MMNFSFTFYDECLHYTYSGIYTAAGQHACDGAQGTSEGFEQQDADLFVNDWGAEYLMIDSCGTPTMPPP